MEFMFFYFFRGRSGWRGGGQNYELPFLENHLPQRLGRTPLGTANGLHLKLNSTTTNLLLRITPKKDDTPHKKYLKQTVGIEPLCAPRISGSCLYFPLFLLRRHLERPAKLNGERTNICITSKEEVQQMPFKPRSGIELCGIFLMFDISKWKYMQGRLHVSPRQSFCICRLFSAFWHHCWWIKRSENERPVE